MTMNQISIFDNQIVKKNVYKIVKKQLNIYRNFKS